MSNEKVYPGADELTASKAQYFSWINNTNEGATSGQTEANLRFFKWLHDEYGMILDIYAFDAGAIDGAGGYGTMSSEAFHRQFPYGFGPHAQLAKSFGGRLGIWCGPDGFGHTAQDARNRIEMMVGLCRDHQFALFKMDGVCGSLREEKQGEFVEMMTRCRQFCPDLILLNHRLNLFAGLPHATTFLWNGVETYIDVHIHNSVCAVHNRVCTLLRGNTPDLKRLTEDHGVCLSSCLDFWEDDLVVQAFGRCLILAPELYGNPWLLRDDEFPRLARYFNLHRRFGGILVRGIPLPEKEFGPHAVSRGDGKTRILVLRNPGWEPQSIRIPLNETIGLKTTGTVQAVKLHPWERHLGEFAFGGELQVTIPAGRAFVLLISAAPIAGPFVEGCDAEVLRDIAGRPVEMRLLGRPGSHEKVRLHMGGRAIASAEIDGRLLPALAEGKTVDVEFPGQAFGLPWHRKLGDLTGVSVPTDAEALYEATCFAADNNAMEVRELERSGPTKIPEVAAARDAFFQQPIFRKRNLWDRQLWDDDAETGLGVCRRWPWYNARVRGGGFRIDFGAPITLDQFTLEVGDEYFLQPLKWHETVHGAVSDDLRTWRPVSFFVDTHINGQIPDDKPWRYLRINGCPDLIREVRAFHRGKKIDRRGWRASNLFSHYHGWRGAMAKHAWQLSFSLPEIVPGAYLAIAIHGKHGVECATAALRVNGASYRGAPRRSPSFPSNTFECPVKPAEGNTTWYIPLTPDLVGQSLDVVAMVLDGGDAQVHVEAWITAYPEPLVARSLVLR